MFEGFSFRENEKYLVTDTLKLLPQYNALEVPSTFVDEAMKKLRDRFLNKPLNVILHPTPQSDRAVVAQVQSNEAHQARVTTEQIMSSIS
jgi:hypothetical protein